MAGKQTKTPRRTTRSSDTSKTKSPSPTKNKNTSQITSPKTPGWISGKNAVFKTPKSQSPSPKKPRTRRSVYHKLGTNMAAEMNDFDFGDSRRRKSEMFKMPESPFGSQTRTRFSIYRKGGMRLVDIPLSPPKGTTRKSASPKGKMKKSASPKGRVKKSASPARPRVRTRRTSVYQKSTLVTSVNIPLEPIVTVSSPRKSTTSSTQQVISPPVPALRRKKVTAKRASVASPVKSSPMSAKKMDAKSKTFTAIKTSKDPKKTPFKTPKSATKQMKRKLDESGENLLASPQMDTPASKRAQKETPTKESPPKSARRTRRTTETPVKSTKTPARKTKTPARAPRSAVKKSSKTPALNEKENLVKSPVKIDLPSSVKKSPVKKKSPAKTKAKSPLKRVSPLKKSPAKTKTPAKKEKSPIKSTKTPASAVKRKRDTEKEIEITPITKRARKNSDIHKKMSPVVILTKTPLGSKKVSSPRSTSTPASPKSFKKLKSPTSSVKKVENRRITALKKSGASPHVKMVTPVSTPNLSAKKRISQRKSTPARVQKTTKSARSTPITTPKLNAKSLVSRKKSVLISENNLKNTSAISNRVYLDSSLNQTQDELDAGNKTIYLDSLTSPTKDVDTTYGSVKGSSSRCVIL